MQQARRNLIMTIICLSLGATAYGATPAQKLWTAACAGDLTGVKQAIAAGAPVDSKGKLNTTGLLCAARDGHLDVVQYLLANGAKIDRNDNDLGKTPLLAASFAGKTDVVNFLLGQHAAVNIQAKNHWTALHDAAYIANLVIVRMLVGAGADLTLVNDRGERPLDTAARVYSDCQNKRTACPTTRGDSTATLPQYKANWAYLKGVTK